MADAIDLAQFYLSEASRLASAALVSEKIDHAEKLRKWLLKVWPHDDVTTREVVQYGPNVLRESPKAKAALGILTEHDWLIAQKDTFVRGAKRKESWRIVQGARDVA